MYFSSFLITETNGVSSNGKTQDFDSCICWFESSYLSFLAKGKYSLIKNKDDNHFVLIITPQSF